MTKNYFKEGICATGHEYGFHPFYTRGDDEVVIFPMGGNDRGIPVQNMIGNGFGISQDNLLVFGTNAQAHNMKARCEKIQADWGRPLVTGAHGEVESGKLIFAGMKKIDNHRLLQIEYKFDYRDEAGGRPELPYLLNIVNEYTQAE